MDKKIGEPGFINKNCWLAKNVNYPPSKRCQYCAGAFKNCLFFRFLIVSAVLIFFMFGIALYMEGKVSKLIIISIFVLVIVYGYFFDKSTESIVVANFAQKKAKEELEELTKNLQQKVDDQTKDIKGAYEVERQAHETLEKTDQVKNQFMAITNHHLRTPLTAISWYVDLLLSGKYGKIPVKSKKIINKIRVSTADEIKIVDDLLNVSQFQLGKEVIKTKQKINIEKVFSQIKENEQPEILEKKIYLKIEKTGEIPEIPADESKLKIALENIVDNAVKYTEKGGVNIKLKIENDELKIVVIDTGIGMEEEGAKNIFDKIFERGGQAQKLFANGKGIGLYLSAKIIEAHQGKIWAESAGKGKGTTFYITLPVA